MTRRGSWTQLKAKRAPRRTGTPRCRQLAKIFNVSPAVLTGATVPVPVADIWRQLTPDDRERVLTAIVAAWWTHEHPTEEAAQ